MGEWKEYKLGDLYDVKGGKRLPKGELLVEYDTGHPYIRVTDLGRKWVKKVGVQFVAAEIQKSISKYTVAANDVILSIVGSIGLTGIISLELAGANLTENCVKFISKTTDIDNNYFYYFLLSQTGQAEIDKRIVGSTQPKLPLYNIKDIDILLPPLPEQKSIASVLSSLDDKIDLLHRQNKTLEALAEALFRQWFIEEAEEGWETRLLEDLIIFDPREKVSNKTEYVFFDMKCLSDYSMAIADGIKRVVNSGSSFRNGDTLLAKITPCLENGKTGFVMNLEEDELARGSTEFIVMRAKEGVSPYFVYCLARYSDFRNTAILSMTGTSGRQRVQTAELRNYEIKYSKDMMERFHNACHPHFQRINQNQIQIRTLTRLRDTLLPKLMSGEIRVKKK